MRDGDLVGQPGGLGAVADEVELERAEVVAVVQVEVDAAAVPLGDGEERVELADRVAVDAGRVESADVLDTLLGCLVEQLVDPRTP